VKKGETVLNIPVLADDKSQLEIVKQEREQNPLITFHGREYNIIYFADQGVGHQLLGDYCFGTNDSLVSWIPLATLPLWTYGENLNVEITWSRHSSHLKALYSSELLSSPHYRLLEVVALDDLKVGERLTAKYSQSFSAWLSSRDNDSGDFISLPLVPGMVAPIRWRAGAEVVSPWAFRIGLPKSVRKGLLSYSDRAGISDLFRHVTYRGNSLSPGTEGVVDLHGLNWLLQRPPSDWKSNLHWLSPADGSTHKNYLESLSFAGFDQVLEGIGEYLGLEGLVAFHVTFIAVSFCMSGYEHHDVEWTGGKTFNIIIPLLLASETGPELELLEGASYFDDRNESITTKDATDTSMILPL